MRLLAGIIKALTLIIILLCLLVIGIMFYSEQQQDLTGKTWCEGLIQSYEADRKKFLANYQEFVTEGRLVIYPETGQEAMGEFKVSESGQFSCSYYHGGFSESGYEYTSQARQWKKQQKM